MKKPEEHETDSKGDALFRGVFAAWGVNYREQDYGWDYAVEVFRDTKSTGLLFNAQLKSSTITRYSSEGTFISQSLERNAADYLATQLRQPTFLFHADVENKRLFWSAIQLDSAVLQSLEKGETKSLTVRIPTSNLLPDAFDRFLADLRKAHFVVVSRALLIANDTDFVDAMRGRPVEKMDGVSDDLHEKAFRIEAQTAHEIFQKGDICEATRRLKVILASPEASLEVRFNVILQLGDLEWIELIRSDQPQIRAAERQLSTGTELCRITKKGPRHLRLFALITRAAAELGVILQKHLGLTMNWVAHKKIGIDPLWLAALSFGLNENLAAAGRKYKQALRLAGITARSPQRGVAPMAIVKVAGQIPVLAQLLEHAGLNEAAQQYRRSAFQLLRMAAAIATENRDIDSLFQVVTLGFRLDPSEDGEIFVWSRSIMECWNPDSEYRRRADQLRRNMRQRRQGIKLENDIETTDRQIHENLLTAFGIDPATQPWAGMIDLALKDADLGRALKGCEHTFVSIGPGNPTLDRLGLQAAGRKTLHCTRHKYAVTGPDLDSVDEAFRREYCNSCQDMTPRPSNWTFNDEWQDQENRRWARHFVDVGPP